MSSSSYIKPWPLRAVRSLRENSTFFLTHKPSCSGYKGPKGPILRMKEKQAVLDRAQHSLLRYENIIGVSQEILKIDTSS